MWSREFRKPTEINQHARRMEILPFQWIFSALDEREFNFSRPKWNETQRNEMKRTEEREIGIESEMKFVETADR